MQVVLVKPQGFCGGVYRAITIALKAKQENPNSKVYVLGALVHNQSVLDDLSKKGIITLEGDDDVKLIKSLSKGDVIIFSAHGHDEKYDEIAKEKGLIIYDTTCIKVKENMNIIKREIDNNHQVIYIGQTGHRETNAALSISNNISLYDIKLLFNYYSITDYSPLVINQTTLNYLDLKKIHEDILSHLPNARIENEICAATRQRQEAILSIPHDVDLIIIVGDKRSSNTNKLYEIASKHYQNTNVVLVSDLNDLLTRVKINGIKKAAISSGASTPQNVVDDIYNYLIKV